MRTKPDFDINTMFPAEEEAARTVIDSPQDIMDGRSEFFWVWTDGGDLMLACYPRGNTFFDTELAREADYNLAAQAGTLRVREGV